MVFSRMDDCRRTGLSAVDMELLIPRLENEWANIGKPNSTAVLTASGISNADGSLDERAAAAKFLHPEWTNREVAESIGCHPKTLNKPNMGKFKLAKEAIDSGREELPKGSKYNGNVDAFEE